MGARHETPKQREAFEAWYADEARELRNLAPSFAKSVRTIQLWAVRYNWGARAEERDKAARERADHDAIKRQAEMLKRHAVLGRNLQAKGTKRLEAGIDSDQAAIRAVQIGVGIERQAEGLPDFIASIMSMNDDQLRKHFDALAAEIAGTGNPGGNNETPGDADSATAEPSSATE